MNIIRCKDCIHDGAIECPLSFIEKQTLCFVEHSPMFFCAKGKSSEDYEPTHGDVVRNMTDRELAERQDIIEKTAFAHGEGGGSMTFGKKNIEFLTGWYGAPDGEDYEPDTE